MVTGSCCADYGHQQLLRWLRPPTAVALSTATGNCSADYGHRQLLPWQRLEEAVTMTMATGSYGNRPCSGHGGPAVDMEALQWARIEALQWTRMPYSGHGCPALDMEALQWTWMPCSWHGWPAVNTEALQRTRRPCSGHWCPTVDTDALQWTCKHCSGHWCPAVDIDALHWIQMPCNGHRCLHSTQIRCSGHECAAVDMEALQRTRLSCSGRGCAAVNMDDPCINSELCGQYQPCFHRHDTRLYSLCLIISVGVLAATSIVETAPVTRNYVNSGPHTNQAVLWNRCEVCWWWAWDNRPGCLGKRCIHIMLHLHRCNVLRGFIQFIQFVILFKTFNLLAADLNPALGRTGREMDCRVWDLVFKSRARF